MVSLFPVRDLSTSCPLTDNTPRNAGSKVMKAYI